MSILDQPAVRRVREALASAGIVAQIVEVPDATRTARAAADFLRCDVAQIANSLVFRTASGRAVRRLRRTPRPARRCFPGGRS